jgi:RimJ/RimL family protein N-acetyltransferase
MSKRDLPALEFGPVRLRLLTQADLPLTLAWRNRDDIRRWFLNSDVLQAQQHIAWFTRYAERDDDFVFIIEEVASGQPVGQVSLYRIEWAARRAEFGRLMIGAAEAAGKGLAHAATRAAVQVGFETLGLKEIHLEVYADNLRAIHIYETCGFARASVQDGVIQMKIVPQS